MGPAIETELLEVELLVEADIVGRQTKVADVVTGSVVVVVGVGTYDMMAISRLEGWSPEGGHLPGC